MSQAAGRQPGKYALHCVDTLDIHANFVIAASLALIEPEMMPCKEIACAGPT